MDRFPSILISLILHLALFTLVLFWPEPSPPPLLQGGRIVQGYVTLGKEGATATDTKASEARPGVPAEQPEVPRPPVQEQPPAVEPQSEAPKEAPTEAPVEQPVPEEQPKPEPQPQEPPKVTEPPQAKPEPPKEPEPDAVQVAEKREPEKKEEPRRNATAKVEPTKNATAQKQPPAKNATAQKKTPEKKESHVKKAMREIAKTTPRERPQSGGTGSGISLTDEALNEMREKIGGTGGDASGYGPGGRGGTGSGAVTQAYMEVVASAIKRNWSLAGRADRKDLYATVRIHLSTDGVIEQYEMVRPSGDRVFDSTLITAIVSTAMVPEAPPTAQDRVIDVNFYP